MEISAKNLFVLEGALTRLKQADGLLAVEQALLSEIEKETNFINELEHHDMRLNNYHCSELECGYKTNANTPEEADKQLVRDGGFDINKNTKCPKCKKDSLVFLHV